MSARFTGLGRRNAIWAPQHIMLLTCPPLTFSKSVGSEALKVDDVLGIGLGRQQGMHKVQVLVLELPLAPTLLHVLALTGHLPCPGQSATPAALRHVRPLKARGPLHTLSAARSCMHAPDRPGGSMARDVDARAERAQRNLTWSELYTTCIKPLATLWQPGCGAFDPCPPLPALPTATRHSSMARPPGWKRGVAPAPPAAGAAPSCSSLAGWCPSAVTAV